MGASFEEFDSFRFSSGEISKEIYRSEFNGGPAVILIHELPGMIPDCQRRGEWLADQGFTVYMPLLFGKPGGKGLGLKPLTYGCVWREFYAWFRKDTSPMVSFLNALAKRAHEECGDEGVGAIGMCLTGGFGLAMMVEPTVKAPVLCQPSIPLFRLNEIGISEQDFETACQRCKKEDIDVLAFRFENDILCRKGRFKKLNEGLGEQFKPHVIGEREGSSKFGHSTITSDFNRISEAEGKEIEEKLVDHLNRYLRSA